MPFSVTVARTALTRSEKVQHLQGQPNKKTPPHHLRGFLMPEGATTGRQIGIKKDPHRKG